MWWIAAIIIVPAAIVTIAGVVVWCINRFCGGAPQRTADLPSDQQQYGAVNDDSEISMQTRE